MKSGGTNTIKNILHKKRQRTSIVGLIDILNNSFKAAYWPDSFKLAKVVPVLGSGKPSNNPRSHR